jgi:hypothetical protein
LVPNYYQSDKAAYTTNARDEIECHDLAKNYDNIVRYVFDFLANKCYLFSSVNLDDGILVNQDASVAFSLESSCF